VRFKGADVAGGRRIAWSSAAWRCVPQGRASSRRSACARTSRSRARATAAGPRRVYELFPRLRERAGNRANKLSGGEQQMLAIGARS
jgi:branched-chain amino acid transport system ATP-binding protein